MRPAAHCDPVTAIGLPSTPNRAPAVVEADFGRTGHPKKVSRTITVDMANSMRFTPAEIT